MGSEVKEGFYNYKGPNRIMKSFIGKHTETKEVLKVFFKYKYSNINKLEQKRNRDRSFLVTCTT